MNQSEDPNFKMKPRRNPSAGIAIAFIVIGSLVLLRNLGLFSADVNYIIFTWQMLLIGIGIWSISRRQVTSGTILIVIGTIFLLPRFGVLFPHWNLNLRVITRNTWPIILIAVGLYMYFRDSERNKARQRIMEQQMRAQATSDAEPSPQESQSEDTTSHTDTHSTYQTVNPDFIDESVLFSSSFKYITSQALIGGYVRVVCGQVVLDLRNTHLKDNRTVIEIDNSLASCIIYVPQHWKVIINTQTTLGSFSDKRFYLATPPEIQQDAPTLIISGNCTLGSGEVR